MNKFIKEMMEIGAWEDRAGSEAERSNAIKAAEELYEKHLAELNLLTIPVVVGQSEQLVCDCGKPYHERDLEHGMCHQCWEPTKEAN